MEKMNCLFRSQSNVSNEQVHTLSIIRQNIYWASDTNNIFVAWERCIVQHFHGGFPFNKPTQNRTHTHDRKTMKFYLAIYTIYIHSSMAAVITKPAQCLRSRMRCHYHAGWCRACSKHYESFEKWINCQWSETKAATSKTTYGTILLRPESTSGVSNNNNTINCVCHVNWIAQSFFSACVYVYRLFFRFG